jgi:hypothetical protein
VAWPSGHLSQTVWHIQEFCEKYLRDADYRTRCDALRLKLLTAMRSGVLVLDQLPDDGRGYLGLAKFVYNQAKLLHSKGTLQLKAAGLVCLIVGVAV